MRAARIGDATGSVEWGRIERVVDAKFETAGELSGFGCPCIDTLRMVGTQSLMQVFACLRRHVAGYGFKNFLTIIHVAAHDTRRDRSGFEIFWRLASHSMHYRLPMLLDW